LEEQQEGIVPSSVSDSLNEISNKEKEVSPSGITESSQNISEK